MTKDEAIQFLRKIKDSDLFRIEEGDDIARVHGNKGVALTWKVWRACKVVVLDAITERKAGG